MFDFCLWVFKWDRLIRILRFSPDTQLIDKAQSELPAEWVAGADSSEGCYQRSCVCIRNFLLLSLQASASYQRQVNSDSHRLVSSLQMRMIHTSIWLDDILNTCLWLVDILYTCLWLDDTLKTWIWLDNILNTCLWLDDILTTCLWLDDVLNTKLVDVACNSDVWERECAKNYLSTSWWEECAGQVVFSTQHMTDWHNPATRVNILNTLSSNLLFPSEDISILAFLPSNVYNNTYK